MSMSPLRTTAPAADSHPPRRLAQGAELTTVDGRRGTHFRIWAPTRSSVEILLEESSGGEQAVHRLEREPDGHW